MNVVDSSVIERACLRHTLATLAYRARKPLTDAPAAFGTFTIGTSTRTPGRILAHVCDLFDWALSMARGKEAWRDSTPGAWDDDVRRFFDAVRAFDDRLASDEPLACSWTRLFQGPVADALTHVGQIALLRRLAEAPVRAENYSRAEIVVGRVGPDQAAPRREF